MNKTDLTTAFEQTSFLYGGNAQFIEQLYAEGAPPRHVTQRLAAESGVTPATADMFLREINRHINRQRRVQGAQVQQQRPQPRAPKLPGGKQVRLPARRPHAS